MTQPGFPPGLDPGSPESSNPAAPSPSSLGDQAGWYAPWTPDSMAPSPVLTPPGVAPSPAVEGPAIAPEGSPRGSAYARLVDPFAEMAR
jgi:hypothetical protein